MKKIFLGFCFVVIGILSFAQFKADKVKWTPDNNGVYENDNNAIVSTNFKTGQQKVIVPADALKANKIGIKDFSITANESQVLIFTNTAKVWRYNTRGDYWLYDAATKKLQQVGKDKPAQSLLYAKLSPDGKKVTKKVELFTWEKLDYVAKVKKAFGLK